MMKQESREISPAIKDHYNVVGVLPGEVHFKGKIYDLRTISKANADKLFEDKFPYLEEKKSAKASSTTTK